MFFSKVKQKNTFIGGDWVLNEITAWFFSQNIKLKSSFAFKNSMTPFWSQKMNLIRLWHYIHQKLRIDISNLTQKSILQNIVRSLRNGQKTGKKQSFGHIAHFELVFWALLGLQKRFFDLLFCAWLLISIRMFWCI